MGLDFEGIVGVILAMTSADFYKSMTTHADHRVWQDVYRPTTSVGEPGFIAQVRKKLALDQREAAWFVERSPEM